MNNFKKILFVISLFLWLAVAIYLLVSTPALAENWEPPKLDTETEVLKYQGNEYVYSNTWDTYANTEAGELVKVRYQYWHHPEHSWIAIGFVFTDTVTIFAVAVNEEKIARYDSDCDKTFDLKRPLEADPVVANCFLVAKIKT